MGDESDLVLWYQDGGCVETNTTLFPEAANDCCEAGLFLATDLPRNAGYLLMSLFMLLYVFLGVALGADVFMTAIEVITSKEKLTTVQVGGEKKTFHTQVWNATVANLTLMALGSSAPEILLNVVDVFKLNYFSGELGPSTIVGSAAFNLMVISAVCIVCLPEGESRTLNQLPVFVVTALWSLWAYIWLLIILKVSSPDIITIPEAVITCLFLAVLVGNAYAVDVHWGSAKKVMEQKIVGIRGGSGITHVAIREELKARESAGGKKKTAEEIASELAQDLIPKTKGDYRRGVIAKCTGSGGGDAPSKGADRTSGPKLQPTITSEGTQLDAIDLEEADDLEKPAVHVGFTRRVVAVIEGVDKVATLTARRQGDLEGELKVRVTTAEEGSAKAHTHFTPVDTTVTFALGVAEATVDIEIIDNDQAENEDTTLTVSLSDPVLSSPGPLGDPGKGKGKVALGGEMQFAACTVQIQDDDKNPGCFKWHAEKVEVLENVGTVTLTVLRTGGLSGEVSIEYKTKDQTATAGKDYVAKEGTLTFAQGVVSQSLTIEIIDDEFYEKDEQFTVVLSEPTGGATFDASTDGGEEAAVCTVVILNDDVITSKLEEVVNLLRLNADNLALARENWGIALRDAVIPQQGSSGKEKFMHFLNVPWKIMFAIVPPPGMCGGVPCFFCALIMIGVQVVLISDFAGMMGCQMNLKPAVTAITFVALGTSLPDTFASMAAARGDKYADNSVGNVTGSNSVNVFLGLGLAWLIAAIYWEMAGPNDEWFERYWDIAMKQAAGAGCANPRDCSAVGGFVVLSGDLGFSVVVFTVCAVITLGTIVARRPHELGGDKKGAYATGAVFCSLWVVYVLLSSMSSYGYIKPPF